MTHEHNIKDNDTHFTVDPVTRVITNQSGKTMLVQYDHNSERFTFSIPRYIEDHDMSQCNMVRIAYVNTGTGTSASVRESNADYYIVNDLKVDPDNEDYVIGSWLISQNATRLSGTLKFQIRFECTISNNDGAADKFIWNTCVYSAINIAEGLDAAEITAEIEPDIIEYWEKKFSQDINSIDEEVEQLGQQVQMHDMFINAEMPEYLRELRELVNNSPKDEEGNFKEAAAADEVRVEKSNFYFEESTDENDYSIYTPREVPENEPVPLNPPISGYNAKIICSPDFVCSFTLRISFLSTGWVSINGVNYYEAGQDINFENIAEPVVIENPQNVPIEISNLSAYTPLKTVVDDVIDRMPVDEEGNLLDAAAKSELDDVKFRIMFARTEISTDNLVFNVMELEDGSVIYTATTPNIGEQAESAPDINSEHTTIKCEPDEALSFTLFLLGDSTEPIIINGTSYDAGAMHSVSFEKVTNPVIIENPSYATIQVVTMTKHYLARGGLMTADDKATLKTLESEVGDISTALDELHAYAQALIGGEE